MVISDNPRVIQNSRTEVLMVHSMFTFEVILDEVSLNARGTVLVKVEKNGLPALRQKILVGSHSTTRANH